MIFISILLTAEDMAFTMTGYLLLWYDAQGERMGGRRYIGLCWRTDWSGCMGLLGQSVSHCRATVGSGRGWWCSRKSKCRGWRGARWPWCISKHGNIQLCCHCSPQGSCYRGRLSHLSSVPLSSVFLCPASLAGATFSHLSYVLINSSSYCCAWKKGDEIVFFLSTFPPMVGLHRQIWAWKKHNEPLCSAPSCPPPAVGASHGAAAVLYLAAPCRTLEVSQKMAVSMKIQQTCWSQGGKITFI